MPTKNYSDAILSKYILKKSQSKEEIPYMTVISKDTGISNATISRYAKKKGFYNFGEMRATFNKTLNSSFVQLDTKGFEKIFNFEKIKIATSKSTELIGEFIKVRLAYTNIDVEIVTEDTTWTAKDFTLFITITGDSLRLQKIMDKAKGKKLIVTTKEIPGLPKTYKQAILSDYEIEIRNIYDISNAVLRITTWMNDIINIHEIKEENNK